MPYSLSVKLRVFSVSHSRYISLCVVILSSQINVHSSRLISIKNKEKRRENFEAWKTYSTVSVVKFTHACAVICFRLPMARVLAGRAPIYHRWKLIKQHYSRVPYQRMVIKIVLSLIIISLEKSFSNFQHFLGIIGNQQFSFLFHGTLIYSTTILHRIIMDSVDVHTRWTSR